MGTEGIDPPAVPIDERAKETKESEKPIELKKEGRFQKVLSFKKGRWLQKAVSFKGRRWSRKTLMIFGVAGVVLLLMGLAFLFRIVGPDRGEDVAEIVSKLHKLHFPLSSFLVPLSSGDQRSRFVWIRIVLQLSEGGGEAIGSDLSRLRSTVFNVIERRRVEEFKSFTGRDMLKKEIKKALNKRLEGVKVQGVLFVDLLVL